MAKRLLIGLVAVLLTGCEPGGDFVFVDGVLTDGGIPATTSSGTGPSSGKRAGEACAASSECAAGLWCNDVSAPPARTCASCVETSAECDQGMVSLCTTDWCQASPTIAQCRPAVPAVACAAPGCMKADTCNGQPVWMDCTPTPGGGGGLTCLCGAGTPGGTPLAKCTEPGDAPCDLAGSCCAQVTGTKAIFSQCP